MKLIDKYILREFFPPLLFGWGVLVGILLLDRFFLLADLIINKGLKIRPVLEILLYSTPFVWATIAPMAVLTASIACFGRLSHDNELSAMRTSGISPLRLLLPLFLPTLILSLSIIAFNHYIVPESNHRLRNLLRDVSRKRPAVRLREGVFMDDFPGYTLYIGSKDERSGAIHNVMVYEKRRGSSPTLVSAKDGMISTTPDEKYLIMTLFSGEIHEMIGDKYRRLSFKKHTINFPLNPELIKKQRRYRGYREMDMRMLYKKIKRIKEEISLKERELSKLYKISPSGERILRIKKIETFLKYKRREKNRYEVEFYEKLSIPIGAILFLFFGTATGFLIRRGGFGTGFLLSLLFFALYYIMVLGGEGLASNGKLPAVFAMWMPDILFILPTLELSMRAWFEKSLFRK